MHPNCRSTTGPYYDESVLKNMKRRARNQEGVGKEIEYKNYREWEAELKARGLKPGHIKNVPNQAEKNLYAKYSSRLKDSPFMPKTIEEFRKTIYYDDGGWLKLKQDFREIGKIDKLDYSKINEKRPIEKPTSNKNAIKLYYKFRKNEEYISDHAIERYLEREYKKNGDVNYSFSNIIKVAKMKPNYIDVVKGGIIMYDEDDTRVAIIKDDKDYNKIVTIMKIGEVKKTWKKK